MTWGLFKEGNLNIEKGVGNLVEIEIDKSMEVLVGIDGEFI